MSIKVATREWEPVNFRDQKLFFNNHYTHSSAQPCRYPDSSEAQGTRIRDGYFA